MTNGWFSRSVGRSVCVACLKMLENSACFTTGKVLLGARRQLPKRFCSLECMVFAVVVVVAVVIVVDDRIMKYFVSSFLFLTHLTGEYSADNPPQSNWNCNKNCVWNRRNVLNSIESTRRRWWRWHPMNFPAIFTDRPFAKIQKKTNSHISVLALCMASFHPQKAFAIQWNTEWNQRV